MTRWHIFTGEYPPQLGGVADYTRLVAEGLAGRGADVHIWTPQGSEGKDNPAPGVTVHRAAGRWSLADFRRIGEALDLFEPPRRLLLQFSPNAFKYKGMNPHLASWLDGRRRLGDSVRVMFHEVTYVVKPGDSLARRMLAVWQRRLVTRLLRAADDVDIAIPFWETMLRPLDPVVNRVYRWRPVPSNVPPIDDPAGIAAIRSRLATRGLTTLIGSFGSFASDTSALLQGGVLPLLLGHPDRAMVLIGRGSDRTADVWLRVYPSLAGQLIATGAIGLDEVSRHLQACDLLLQPYPGGVCSKRTTAMAAIAQGLATVTNTGEATEPIWAESGAMALVIEGDSAAMAGLAESLLANPSARARLGEAGRALYEDRCALIHTLDALTAPAETVRS